MRSFVALKTFDCPELKSIYVEGLSYTIRPGNRYLNALAEVWTLEGKVQFKHGSKQAEVSGKGIVVNPPPTPPQVVVWAPAMEPVVVEDTPQPVEVQILVEPVIEPEPIVQPLDKSIWQKTKDVWRSLWP